MRKERITVIVPVYKVEAYLRKCVDSVLAQTYTNLEVILVDDGSPDGCPAICDAYAAQDSRVRVIHKPNGGVSSARNAGLDAATGDYIAFVDSDDWIAPEMLRSLAEALQTQGAAVAACPSAEYLQNEVFSCGNAYNWPQPVIAGQPLMENCFFRIAKEQGPRINLFMTVWGKLFRQELWDNVRFREDLSLGEDVQAWLEVIIKEPKLALVFTPMYCFRLRGDSAFSRLDIARKAAGRLKRSAITLDTVGKNPDYYAPALENYIFAAVTALLSAGRQDVKPLCGAVLQKLRQHRAAIRRHMPEYRAKYRLAVGALLYAPRISCLAICLRAHLRR